LATGKSVPVSVIAGMTLLLAVCGWIVGGTEGGSDLIEQPSCWWMKPCPGKEFFVPRSPLSVQMRSSSDARTEVLSKSKVNGAGGLRTYLSFTHSAFSW